MKIVPKPQASLLSGVSKPSASFKAAMDGVTPKIPQVLKGPLLPSYKAVAPAAVPSAAAKPALPARPVVNVKQHEAVAASMQRARDHVNATAQNLSDLRTQHMETAQTQQHARLVDLICQELRAEFGGDMKVAANSDKPVPFKTGPVVPISSAASAGPAAHAGEAGQALGAPSSIPPEASVKAASAVELIEKIETFMRTQRPGLAITLEGSLGARVEIERLGPKEVAVRLVGKNGPPSAEAIGRIRDEIRARGLKVGALSVA
jgi:hypothetical protein